MAAKPPIFASYFKKDLEWTFTNPTFCTFTKGIMENLKVVELTGANRWDFNSLQMNLQTNARNLVCVTLHRKALWPCMVTKQRPRQETKKWCISTIFGPISMKFWLHKSFWPPGKHAKFHQGC